MESSTLKKTSPEALSPTGGPCMSPAGLAMGVPWDGEAVSMLGVCPRAPVPASSCAEEVTRCSPVLEKDLGEAGRTGGMLGCGVSLPPPAATSECRQRRRCSELEARPCHGWQLRLVAIPGGQGVPAAPAGHRWPLALNPEMGDGAGTAVTPAQGAGLGAAFWQAQQAGAENHSPCLEVSCRILLAVC